jgi:hypothetical protein
MRKLLLITCLLIGTVAFAQQVETKDAFRNSETPPPTLTEISAYPNPFSVNTKINFKSTKAQIVEFTVKNLLGKTVYLEQINAKEGFNAVLFERNNITKGMYIYSLKTETEVVSKRLVIR